MEQRDPGVEVGPQPIHQRQRERDLGTRTSAGRPASSEAAIPST